MNDELWRQLKEAGFPQEGKQSFYHQNILIRHIKKDTWYPGTREPLLKLPNHGRDGNYDFGWYSSEYEWDWKNHIYVPTLSELIEACKEKFKKLEYFPDTENEVNSWGAFPIIGEGELLGIGSNPEEAVANLWLTLNKKV